MECPIFVLGFLAYLTRAATFGGSGSFLYFALDHAHAAVFGGSGSVSYRDREAAFSTSANPLYFCF